MNNRHTIRKYFLPVAGLFLLLFVLSSCLKEDINNASDGARLGESTFVYEVTESYKGEDLILTRSVLGGAWSFTGLVVSDTATTNMPRTYIVVHGTDTKKKRGLVLTLTNAADNIYVPGDNIKVNIENKTLVRRDGVLQVTGITPGDITLLSHIDSIQATTVSVNLLSSQFEKYENMLVCVNGDLSELPKAGETLQGVHSVGDGSGFVISIPVNDDANFAGLKIKPSAQYTGIVQMGPNGEKFLRMRVGSDMKFACGPLYAKVNGDANVNFPEGFEFPDVAVKSSYASKEISTKTGKWVLNQCLLGNTSGRDRFNPTGLQSIRFQQNLTTDALLEMRFDVALGASKVTFTYGSYYTDASSTFGLAYSQDGGVTWTQAGGWISDASAETKVATFIMDLDGAVRFRIIKKGLGTTSTLTGVKNGRLCIDDFAIYQNQW